MKSLCIEFCEWEMNTLSVLTNVGSGNVMS